MIDGFCPVGDAAAWVFPAERGELAGPPLLRLA